MEKKMRVVKVFGLPRTCTNAVEVLIRRNFKVRVLNNFPCWKHGKNTISGRSIHKKDIDTDDLTFVVCTKNPYDWLNSLFKFENDTKLRRGKTLLEFLTKPSWHYKDVNWLKDKTPIGAFNILTKHWLSINKSPNVLQQIQNEQMLSDQMEILNRLEKAFGWERKNKKLQPLKARIAPGLKDTGKHFVFSENTFKRKEIYLINQRLDKNTLALAGYKIKATH